ncbi:TNF receptor-associated factor 6-like [Belonocnema kinseyi]|uniref:TNF receptor-associated factor 6-like n=1 Tax=Belonocnema kinseyi TaxID=2817044 RepID=UPI00143D1365|nr:TNF receptor-associated factor 6-like [Belonocnema kinseyi]
MAEGENEKESSKVAEESSLCAGEGRSSDLDSRFECPICINWLKDPVLTSCGHKFCSECINTWLTKQGAACPVDSKPLNPEDLFPDLFTKREIAQQRTYCLYQEYGCTVELSPIELESHMSECSYQKNAFFTQPNCPFKSIGCREVFKTAETLKRHLEENMDSHMMMIATYLSHLTLKSNIDAKAVEATFWDAPKKEGEAETSSEHESQSLIHELFEKVLILEQRNQELSLALENLESSIQERTCNGSYIWKLESFEEKLKSMTANRLNMNFSPSFYTSANGYKVCARVNVSHKNSDFLSLVLHISKSENDDTLDWPFEGWISFLLVHPEDPGKSISESAHSLPNLEAFQRPINHSVNRKSYGFTEFVSLQHLENFVKNDCVVIRIDVRATSKLEKKIKADSAAAAAAAAGAVSPLTEENLKIHTEV